MRTALADSSRGGQGYGERIPQALLKGVAPRSSLGSKRNAASMRDAGPSMASLVRTRDWSMTPLGAREDWPPSLHAVVDLILASPLPMVVLWGPSLIQIYNDSYALVAGAKHPAALGQPTRDCWPEVWEFNVPIYRAIFQGETRSFTDQKLVLSRHGAPEKAWFDLSYSPVHDGAGGVAGVLVVVVETTARKSLSLQLKVEKKALRAANLKLTAEDRKLRSLFKQAPGFMCVMRGPEHVFELVNAAYSQLIGHRSVIGMTVRAALPELEAEEQEFPKLLDHVYASGEAFTGRQMKFKVQRQPGMAIETRYVDLVYQPITDTKGRVDGIFIQGSDVTQAKQAVDSLRETEAQLHRMIEFNPQVPWTADANGKISAFDKRWFDLSGLSYDEAIGDKGGQTVHPDDRAELVSAWSHAIATGEPFNIEIRQRMADGSYRWMQSRAFARSDASSEVGQWFGYTEDIHERKLAQDAVCASEARFQAMADSIDQIIWSAKADGISDYYNQRWYEFTGARRGLVLGEQWGHRLHPDDRDRASASWLRSLATGDPGQSEYRLRHHSGAYRWMLGRVQPVCDEQGVITRWYGTCTDIQDIVEARDIIARSQEELEERVAHRTTSLRVSNEQLHQEIAERAKTEEQLRQAQKMEAIGKLTGGMAHDFNNVLAALVGNIELAQTQTADPVIGRYLHNAHHAADRGVKLVDQLLAFARKQPLRQQPCDLNQLSTSFKNLITRTIGPAIRIKLSLSAHLWTVVADATQFEMALLNLAVNAGHAMPHGGTLVITTRNVAADSADLPSDLAPGDYTCLSVRDTGTGMSAAVANRVFEPFFTTKEAGEGSGLGLSQVYGFSKQLGGTVTLSSQLGVGTCVDIFFPRATEPEALPAPAPAAVCRPPKMPQSQPRCVLVIDDDPDVRDMMVDTLRALGFEVVQAESGQEGLAVLGRNTEIDFVITDFSMPEMNGIEFIRRVRLEQRDLPCLLVTGYADIAKFTAEVSSHTSFLKKPFRVDKLAQAVGELLAHEPPRVAKAGVPSRAMH